MHSQLRNLLKLNTSANPDCSVDTGNRYAEHGRTTVPDASYKSHHADLVLQRAHYKTKDPRPAASLCALIELLAEHEDELTEQALLLLSDSFGTARTLYLQSGMKDAAHNFFSTNLYHIKVVIVLSRCRMCDVDFLMKKESVTPMETYGLLRRMLLPLASHPFTAKIDEVIREHEQRELKLGDNASFEAGQLQQMMKQQHGFDDSLQCRLGVLQAQLHGFTPSAFSKLEELRDSGALSEPQFQQQLATARALTPGGETAKRIVARLLPDGFAMRHELPMQTDEEKQRAADRLEDYRDASGIYPGDIYGVNDEVDELEAQRKEAHAARTQFDTVTGKKRAHVEMEPPAQGASPPRCRLPPPAQPPAQQQGAPAAQPDELKIRAHNAYVELTLKASVGQIVGRFVHHLLPLILTGQKLDLPPDSAKRISAHRAVLYKALSLTVDGAGKPQPGRLQHVLHQVVTSGVGVES